MKRCRYCAWRTGPAVQPSTSMSGSEVSSPAVSAKGARCSLLSPLSRRHSADAPPPSPPPPPSPALQQAAAAGEARARRSAEEAQRLRARVACLSGHHSALAACSLPQLQALHRHLAAALTSVSAPLHSLSHLRPPRPT